MQPIDLKRKSRKSKQQPKLASVLSHIPRLHIIAAVSLSLALGIFMMLPSKETEARRHQLEIPIPALAEHISTDIAAPLATQAFEQPIAEPNITVKSEKVKSGDNLSLIFKRAGLTDRHMMELLSAEQGKKLASLYPGHSLTFTINTDGVLQKLTYIKDRLNSFSYSRTANGFSYDENNREPDAILTSRQATITDSLFLAGKDARMDDKLVMELAGIFGWDIDFMLDIRQGDSFKVVYEELFLDGDKIGDGNIVAAQFTNRGKTFRAVRYEDTSGNTQYYTPSGDTMRKEFLRSPIDFARISSHFNLRRKHPVLNKIRAHKGTDYAAGHGTPIRSAGDGKVVYAGKKGGYGNVVIVQHGQTYKTLYAHISKFRRGIRKGVRVKQGQVIAYVGSTGLATGPHLHYEFYVNGAVRNPVTIKLPKAQSVSKAELQRFYQQTQPLLAELDPQMNTTNIASKDTISGTKKL